MLLASSEAYRLWAPLYDSNPNPLLALEGRILTGILAHYGSRIVIDIGCGTGRGMRLCQLSCASVFGMDSSAEMLIEGNRKPSLIGRLVRGHVSALPFGPAIADVTLCSFAASYFPDVCKAMAEMARITRPLGVAILSDLHPAAEARGWTRSFRVADTVYEVAHHRHSDQEMNESAEKAGLQLNDRIDASFSEQERSLFSRAGKEHLFAEACAVPAVRLYIWSKACF